jgi:hypothetical protein
MDRPEKWLAAAEPDADESDFSAVSFQLYAKRRLDVLFEVAGRLKVADREMLCKLLRSSLVSRHRQPRRSRGKRASEPKGCVQAPDRWNNRPGVDRVVADKADLLPALGRARPWFLSSRNCLDTYELFNNSLGQLGSVWHGKVLTKGLITIQRPKRLALDVLHHFPITCWPD